MRLFLRVFVLVLLSFLLWFQRDFPTTLYAQSCGSTLVLDNYGCNAPIFEQGIGWSCGQVVNKGGQTTYNCELVGGNCQTTISACSSNDEGKDCVLKWAAFDPWCSPDNCSKGSCWVAGSPTPAPTPPPGGCGGSCTNGCDTGLSCDTAADPDVCWGDSCVSDPPPPPGCDATAPSNLSADSITSGYEAFLNWNIGANGNSERLKLDTSQNKVANGCPYPNNCLIEKNFTNPATNNYYTGDYGTGNNLSKGTNYYWKIINRKSASCQASRTSNFITNCAVNASDINTNKGAKINNWSPNSINVTKNSYISKVVFTSGNSSILSVNPSQDTSSPFQTNLEGMSVGTTTLKVQVYYAYDGRVGCSTDVSVDVGRPLAWWQVREADVVTSGDVKSDIPYTTCTGSCTPIFSLRKNDGTGYNGVTIYGSSSAFDFGAGPGDPLGTNRIGERDHWLVSADVSPSQTYNYDYFSSKVPSGAVITSVSSADAKQRIETGGTAYNGYYWYKAIGNLDLNPITIPNGKKVILLIEAGNLNLNGDVNLTDGQAFFMAVVNGNINVGAAVTTVKGLYVADGTFSTGTRYPPTADAKLSVRGSVIAYGNPGVNLQRDRRGNNDTSPSEVFTYGPELILMFPSDLKSTKISWKEVAP